ncbi:hypothetical protein CFAM422_001472 [Trichoderma lentiforme]|uniref:Uncharacterized protein n=1 Tax=Trichoderma lentiforme TaxID=1567552 RepID=A0A9P4XPQ7_9HYPO|nr:hypothetical protein CFAM422_001472 [Trichoderma lentiforme]
MADQGTIAAWAALAAALLALVVALAQAAQQYAATAQDMKRCERSVWGPMPGYAGRRVFLWRQLRFRIVLDVPNIFIPTEYWEKPGNARQFPAHRITVLPLPFDRRPVNSDTESAIQNHSEACWVAFARQVSHVCPSAVRVGLMAGDADRLPADIPVVPMQVSLRDIIALGLMIGMKIQAVSEDHIEMSGPFGFIKSSSHPILGSLIHFSAFSTTPHIKGLKTGDIGQSWLRRLTGIASVANQQFEEPKRHYYASLMMRWRTNSTRIPFKIEDFDSDTRGREEGEEEGESQLKFVDLEGKEHRACRQVFNMAKSNGIATAPYIVLGPENKAVAPKSWKPLLKVVRKGDLKTIFKTQEKDTKHAIRTPESPASPAEASLRDAADNITHADSPEPDRDISLDPLTQGDTTQNTTERDVHVLNRRSINLTNQTAPIQSKYLENGKEPLALTWVEVPPGTYRRPTVDDYPDRYEDSRSRSFSELDIHISRNRYGGSRRPRRLSRVRRRDPSFDPERWWRDKQTRAYYSSSERSLDALDPPLLTFYWASQIDIELGCWATPWEKGLYSSCIDALGMMVDIGLAGLSETARLAQPKVNRDSNEILYAEFPGPVILEDLWLHLREGQHTWPPYATNARGGVRGLATHSLIQHSAFRDDERLPQLTLLNSVHKARMSTAKTSTASQNLERDRILELASIDFWLSHAAATNSISEGKSNLIINTPAIVEEI